MATILSPGEVVNGYTIVRVLSRGANAIAYEARKSSGEKYFFKQYKSPGPRTTWYRGFIGYQAEIKRRIEESEARRFCYRLVEFFESSVGAPCYFQVFELIEEGTDLRTLLGERSVIWDQRLTWARVLMAGIAAVHDAGVIHCDLKPENVHLIRDPSVEVGHTLRLIDFDYSIQTDRRAPWDIPGSGQGYIGSPNYYSPEHLASPPPVTASDVFTCGLILCELLSGAHPYASDDENRYRKLAFAGAAPPPRLLGSIGSPEKDAAVAEILHRALSPRAKERPTAREVLNALKGRAGAGASPVDRWKCPACGVENRASDTRVCEACGKVQYGHLVLCAEKTRKELPMNVPTAVGRALLEGILEAGDLSYVSTAQFRADRDAALGCWTVAPEPAAHNATFLNRASLSSAKPLRDGDVLSIGGSYAKLRVSIRY